eukprot:gnl/TRDRNA2_/TRDRNA2_130004_c0_seq1.p1 gnl/TRDRNA2_/TRDRNA2_130004_c0~~gnl/TRDRNA2_/TRDRNA2_130004_c0_seq1.p1  ORF type:complete len:795 (+),score=102.33 gnl/TRDRNA2_/TRDRNA2_130004_c0_seq1:359-2386(+)
MRPSNTVSGSYAARPPQVTSVKRSASPARGSPVNRADLGASVGTVNLAFCVGDFQVAAGEVAKARASPPPEVSSPVAKVITAAGPLRRISTGQADVESRQNGSGAGPAPPQRSLSSNTLAARKPAASTGAVVDNSSNGCHGPSARPSGGLIWDTSPSTNAQAGGYEDPNGLKAGDRVRIGERIFTATGMLGQGSFGTVWAAEGDGFKVAIKEMNITSQEVLAAVMREADFLARLGDAVESREDSQGIGPSQIPRLIAVEKGASSDGTRVRLAMTRLPGEQLYHFLERRRLTISLVRTEPRQQLAEACDFTRLMLGQLAPALLRVASLSYHRDANPHNILIEDAAGDSPQFGLIDFGLAVDSARWNGGYNLNSPPSKLLQSPAGFPEFARAWTELGVSGDCRYWPSSAWMMFTHGIQELAMRPQLCNEYAWRLDMHSIGLSALQVLCVMAPPKPNLPTADNPHGDKVLIRLRELQSAWDRYWEDASALWRRIYSTFTSGGCVMKLQKEYKQARVHELTLRNVQSLRDCLHEILQAFAASPPDASLRGVAAVVRAIHTLISAGEELGPEPNWQKVCLLLGVEPPAPAKNPAHTGGATVTSQQGSAQPYPQTRSGSAMQPGAQRVSPSLMGSTASATTSAGSVVSSSAPSSPMSLSGGYGRGHGQHTFDRSRPLVMLR